MPSIAGGALVLDCPSRCKMRTLTLCCLNRYREIFPTPCLQHMFLLTLGFQDDSNLYLKHVTKYNKITSKVWSYNSLIESGGDSKRDEIGFLDYQVLQWSQM